jgi:hypothetical protein
MSRPASLLWISSTLPIRRDAVVPLHRSHPLLVGLDFQQVIAVIEFRPDRDVVVGVIDDRGDPAVLVAEVRHSDRVVVEQPREVRTVVDTHRRHTGARPGAGHRRRGRRRGRCPVTGSPPKVTRAPSAAPVRGHRLIGLCRWPACPDGGRHEQLPRAGPKVPSRDERRSPASWFTVQRRRCLRRTRAGLHHQCASMDSDNQEMIC